MITHLYLCGQISNGGTLPAGEVAANLARFDAAAQRLRAAGYTVHNPADTARDWPGLTWDQYMERSAFRMDYLERMHPGAWAVATMPGWGDSKGAREEMRAAAAMGAKVRPVDVWAREGVARQAKGEFANA